LTDIPEVQAGEAKPEDGAQLIPSLGGGHVARWQRIRAFHVWVSVSRLAVPNDGAETEKPVCHAERDRTQTAQSTGCEQVQNIAPCALYRWRQWLLANQV